MERQGSLDGSKDGDEEQQKVRMSKDRLHQHQEVDVRT